MKVVDVLTLLDMSSSFTLAKMYDSGIYPAIKEIPEAVYTREDIPLKILQRYMFRKVKGIRQGTVNGQNVIIITIY